MQIRGFPCHGNFKLSSLTLFSAVEHAPFTLNPRTLSLGCVPRSSGILRKWSSRPPPNHAITTGAFQHPAPKGPKPDKGAMIYEESLTLRDLGGVPLRDPLGVPLRDLLWVPSRDLFRIPLRDLLGGSLGALRTHVARDRSLSAEGLAALRVWGVRLGPWGSGLGFRV